MIEFVLELIFELIVEGSVELLIDGAADAKKRKKIPIVVRVIAALIVLTVYGGLIGFCYYYAVVNKSWVLGLLGSFILLITALAWIKTYRKVKSRKAETVTEEQQM